MAELQGWIQVVLSVATLIVEIFFNIRKSPPGGGDNHNIED